MRFVLGQRVKIVKRNYGDPDVLDPEDDDPEVRWLLSFEGKTGTIRGILTNCTVGETEKDPLYKVAVVGVGTDGFWGEELEKIR